MNRSKYPRTYHLPWSESKTDDDKTLDENQTNSNFANKIVVVTEKLDGENTTIYSDGYCHARSIDSKNHESRSYVKSIASIIGYKIPNGWRIVGENLFAQHSIEYTKLPDYFIVFGIVNENDICLSWSEIEEYSKILGLSSAPVIYKGLYNEKLIKSISLKSSSFGDKIEGYVIRNVDGFHMLQFSNNVAKFVRKNHVQSSQHWMYQKVVPNKLVWFK